MSFVLNVHVSYSIMALQQKKNLGGQLLASSFQEDYRNKRQQTKRLPMDVVHERGSSAERSLPESDSDDGYEDVDER